VTSTTVTPLTVVLIRSSPAFPPTLGFLLKNEGVNMARVEVRSLQKRRTIVESLPFTKTNYQILGLGILFIVLGYYALAQPPWDGTMPLVVAPILLVTGYCILIPVGILFRRKVEHEMPRTPQAADGKTV
jgi:hypothetical protein